MNTYIWKVLQKSEREKIHKEVQITHTQLDFEYDLVTLHSVVNLLSKICWSGKTPPPNETGSSLRVGIWTYCHTITPCLSLLQTYVNSTLTCFPKLGFRTNSKLHSLYFVTQDTYRLKMSDKVQKAYLFKLEALNESVRGQYELVYLPETDSSPCLFFVST